MLGVGTKFFLKSTMRGAIAGAFSYLGLTMLTDLSQQKCVFAFATFSIAGVVVGIVGLLMFSGDHK
jgi:hypothetical protein